MRPALVALAVGITLAGATSCGDDAAPPDRFERCATAGRPSPSAVAGQVVDRGFWRLVEQSCRLDGDGDAGQADAMRRVMDGLTAAEVADVHRTLVQANHSLDTATFTAAADAICAPGLGLGDDLGTDFRSWVIAHGQRTYDTVLADPAALADLPGVEDGCGLGEFFGYAASGLYDELTGKEPGEDGLPPIEP